jgi:hypothetical protein
MKCAVYDEAQLGLESIAQTKQDKVCMLMVCVCSLSIRKFWSSVIFISSSLYGFNISEIVPIYASINLITCFWSECFVSFASSTSKDWQMIACNDVYEFCSTHLASR